MKNLILFSLFFNTLILAATAQQNIKMERRPTTGYAPVNGINMYYEIYGKGEIPLILIHGGGSTIESTFGLMLPMLANNYQIIAVELQAHGRTNDRDVPESFEQDADDVVALLKYLKISKSNILGFSNGGTTTLQIAIRHPEMVNKIIAISASYQREGMIEGFFENMHHATIDNMPEFLKMAFLKVTPDQKKLQIMFEKDRDRMIKFKDIPDEMMKAIKSPALFIVGDQDVVKVEHVLKMSKLLEKTKLVVLPGTHGSFIGEAGSMVVGSKMPEITTALIDEFLNN